MDQILTMRAGHKGLTNRACGAWGPDGQCARYDVLEYSLGDEAFRRSVNDLGFVCTVGGRRFKVCMDKPGFCRFKYTRRSIFHRTVRNEEYIAAADRLDFLVGARTRCVQKDRYPIEPAWGAGAWGAQ